MPIHENSREIISAGFCIDFSQISHDFCIDFFLTKEQKEQKKFTPIHENSREIISAGFCIDFSQILTDFCIDFSQILLILQVQTTNCLHFVSVSLMRHSYYDLFQEAH